LRDYGVVLRSRTRRASALCLGSTDDKLGIDDSNVLDAVKAMYRKAIGEDDRAVPDEQQRQDAASQLHGFHISRSWFRD